MTTGARRGGFSDLPERPWHAADGTDTTNRPLPPIRRRRSASPVVGLVAGSVISGLFLLAGFVWVVAGFFRALAPSPAGQEGAVAAAPGEQGPRHQPPLLPPDALAPPGAPAAVVPDAKDLQGAEGEVVLDDLLRAPPTGQGRPVALPDDLAQVPEVALHEPLPHNLPPQQARQQLTRLAARMGRLNQQQDDGFLRALLRQRPDLAGLPFLLGGPCRQDRDTARRFVAAVRDVRSALSLLRPGSEERFWDRYQAVSARRGGTAGGACDDGIHTARVAALTQILAPESAPARSLLARHLAAVPDVRATRELARMAVFSPEADVRQAAIKGLQLRRERDYSDVLLNAFRYPWPAVARNAADAAAKLGRTDLAPHLVSLLEEPDPRAPVLRVVRGKRAPVVRELVRVNHHRNCLLCHSPVSHEGGLPGQEVATGPAPSPSEALPSPAQGYRSGPRRRDDVFVRADVTYLRQDFSQMQAVANAAPWPAIQRFDFVVRRRVLTDAEAAAYGAKLAQAERDGGSPYRQAALAALRELTGRDAGPTPQAWRRLLAQTAARPDAAAMRD
jgi:hypothetical protein